MALGPLRGYFRSHQLVDHGQGIFLALVITFHQSPGLIAKRFVKVSRLDIIGAQFEIYGCNPRGTAGRFEPFDQRLSDPATTLARFDGKQVQVRMDLVELHHREADDFDPRPRDQHHAFRVLYHVQ